jgi:broad specificity polyphosphatase/5'/3'-nucleotidase SurE
MRILVTNDDGIHAGLVSRLRCSAQRCTADPGPSFVFE